MVFILWHKYFCMCTVKQIASPPHSDFRESFLYFSKYSGVFLLFLKSLVTDIITHRQRYTCADAVIQIDDSTD